METRRWVNQSQPQTLYMGTILLYVEAVMGLLLGSSFLYLYGYWFGGALPGIALLVAMFASGYGVANERKWGFQLGVFTSGAAVVAGAVILAFNGIGELFDFGFASISLFSVALFVLLIHPQSRDYARIWFK